jgi:taurine transport system permease protein
MAWMKLGNGMGASRMQILPNALPEIFAGLRTSMGVCWATVVAADEGIGSMIMIA